MLAPFLFALPFLSPSIQDPAAGTLTAIEDLRSLTRSTPPQTPPQFGSLLLDMTTRPRVDLLEVESEDAGPQGEEVAIALRWQHADAFDAERVSAIVRGEHLVLRGERDAVTRVQKTIHDATRVLSRPLLVELALWDVADRETPAAVLDAAGYARFAANQVPLWRVVATGTAGQPIALEHLVWTQYVEQFEAGAAQRKTLLLPELGRFGEGVQGVVRAYPLLGSDELAVFVQFAGGRRRGVVRQLELGAGDGAAVDLPTLESVFGGTAGRLRSGGALAATLRGNPATGGQFVVTVRCEARMPAAALDGAALLPCGALCSDALLRGVDLDDETDFRDVEFVSSALDAMYKEQLTELAREAAADERTRIHWVRHHLLVQGSDAARQRVETMLRELQERTVQNVTFRHTARLEANAANAPAGEPPSLHEIVLPSLFGRRAIGCRLLETKVVASLDGALGQEVAVMAPRTEALQSGTWLMARSAPVRELLHTEVALRSAHAPMPAVRSLLPNGGMLMPSESSVITTTHDGVLAPGQWIEHGQGPSLSIEGRSFRTSMTTTAQR